MQQPNLISSKPIGLRSCATSKPWSFLGKTQLHFVHGAAYELPTVYTLLQTSVANTHTPLKCGGLETSPSSLVHRKENFVSRVAMMRNTGEIAQGHAGRKVRLATADW